MDLHNHVIEQIVIAISGKTTWFGAATSVTSGAAGLLAREVAYNPVVAVKVMELSHIGILFGMCVGGFSALTGWYFSRKRDARESAKRTEEAEIAEMQKRILAEQLDLRYSQGDK